MEKTVKLTIDGKEVQSPEGMNLMDAAELAGIHIPNLCYLKGMKGIGACRLCLIEIEGLKAPMIACNTKVREGMVVNTKTEKVQEIRKFIIDLILSMHPLDCMTCTKAGICNLQKYAYEFDLKESSFTRKKFGYPVDEANPFIKRDPDYCILCGRCVRVCKEQGTNVLEFMGRGIGSKIVTANDKPLQESECTFCGSCVDSCPVNALLEADRWRKGREWEYERINSVCLLCGNGCEITVSTKDGRVQKISSGAPAGSAEKYICAYGRFGFDCIEAETRLTSPMKKIDGELRGTTWEDALKIVADELKKAGKDAGFISAAGILNEDALTLKKLARDVVKTRNFDTTVSLYADSDSLKKSQRADIDRSDLIFLLGLNPSQWERVLPALDAAVRRRINRGAKLVVINSSETRIADVATVSLKGDEISNIKGIIKVAIEKGLKADKKLESSVKDIESTEEIEKASALFIEAKQPIIFSSPALFEAASNLSLLKGKKVIAIPLESNARGVVLMGLTTEGKTYREMLTDKMKALYVVGEVPLNKRPDTDFLIVQNSHLTGLAREADVVLPSATFLESAGTITDFMGRMKYLPEVIEPQGESKSHRDIFILLAKIMGSTIKRPTEAEVKKASNIKVKLSPVPFVKKEGLDISPQEMIESINASVINGSRLLWLKETEKTIAV
ncbi:MAG: molybdopterin-dependent oxidoreductase [Nitrospirae bacterium]|jgi:predicted molibdopterin-dependent oxidoreductase YjgC|nr:molybdopterin-dependent oxidoreductase [Nitrospirota bacterium]